MTVSFHKCNFQNEIYLLQEKKSTNSTFPIFYYSILFIPYQDEEGGGGGIIYIYNQNELEQLQLTPG